MIDMHTHFMARRLLEAAASNGSRFQLRVTPVGDDTYSLQTEFPSMFSSKPTTVTPFHYDWATRVQALGARGITVQVASSATTLSTYWAEEEVSREVVQLINDDLSDAARLHPGRIFGLASLPLPHVKASIGEVDRLASLPGIKGVLMLSSINGRNLSDREFDPLYARIEEADLPIFVHPGSGLSPERMSEHFLFNVVGFPTEQALAAASVVLGGVLDRFPKLTFCFGHGGGAFLFLLGRIECGYDVSDVLASGIHDRPLNYLKSVYVDCLLHDDRALRYITETIGPDHVMLGTDWPWPMEDTDVVDRVRRADTLSVDERQLILFDNANRVFRLGLV